MYDLFKLADKLMEGARAQLARDNERLRQMEEQQKRALDKKSA